jgi:cobaltochelatase CobN
VASVIEDKPHALAGQCGQADEVLAFISATVLPKLYATTDEMQACLDGLSGRFVKPGPSGAPTRGQVDILPTGRNFYSVDPQKLPSSGAWHIGMDLGNDLVERHIRETGSPPEQVGMVIWGSPNMRTQGECIAESLYLMGLKPVWNPKNGRVLEGLTVTPLNELEIPPQWMSPSAPQAFSATAFPISWELLDEAAVLMASALNEPPESNFLRRNVMKGS